jgi:MFS family permease
MAEFLEFVKAWAKLISELFAKYPIAGALITLLVVVLFYIYEEENGPTDWSKRSAHFLVALLGWAIAVPIIGWIFNRIEEIWNAIRIVVSALVKFALFVYQRYEHHPILVLALAAASAVIFLVWGFLKRDRRHPAVKAIACLALFCVGVIVASPIADLFTPPNGNAGQKATTNVASAPSPLPSEGRSAPVPQVASGGSSAATPTSTNPSSPAAASALAVPGEKSAAEPKK